MTDAGLCPFPLLLAMPVISLYLLYGMCGWVAAVREPEQKRPRTEHEEDAATVIAPQLPTLPSSLAVTGVFQCISRCVSPWAAALAPQCYPPTAQDRTNITKGVKFSPDGSSLLVASEDAHLRVLGFRDAKVLGRVVIGLAVVEGLRVRRQWRCPLSIRTLHCP